MMRCESIQQLGRDEYDAQFFSEMRDEAQPTYSRLKHIPISKLSSDHVVYKRAHRKVVQVGNQYGHAISYLEIS